MNIKDLLLTEFDQEAEGTRKVLARIPEDKFGWKPHPKSKTLSQLSIHVANLPFFAAKVLGADSFDISTARPPAEPADQNELLSRFEEVQREARHAISTTDEASLMKPWSLTNGAFVIFTVPKYFALRRLLMNHLIHHRAQLTLYLRLNDVAVPGLFGPSADE